MSEKEETFCRLCAEPTPEEQLIKSDDEVALNSKIATKMLWINIDVSSSNYLPNTICFSCFDLLEKTWNFLQNVRTAQVKLNDIYSKNLESPLRSEVKPVTNHKEVGRPVDRSWEDFQDNKAEVKVEMAPNTDHITTVDASVLLNSHLDMNVIVKRESGASDEAMFYNDNITDGFNSTDSDQPLLNVKTKQRKKLKKKKKKKRKHDQDIDLDLLPNSTADAIPLDMSLYNITWDDYTWRCAKCDAQCKTIASLRLHSLEIHSCCCIFKCSDCDKILTNHRAFINHVRLHNNSLRYCCDICNKTFKMLQYVRKHRSLEHGELHLVCQNCGTMFDTREQLQDHILMFAKGYRKQLTKNREQMERALKCQHCEKEFKSISNLRAHKLVHTVRAREFSCHVCGKMFFTKGALSTHMAVHEDVKPYKCEFCQMAFKARGNLISHISLHSGSKPFVCEQCGKSFRVKRHLKSHSIVHTDLMPYVCQYCNKPFRFKTRLNLHLRQHTGTKPYKCVYCQRDFTNGSNYKKHMKRRHNIDTSRKKYQESVPIVAAPIELNISANSSIE